MRYNNGEATKGRDDDKYLENHDKIDFAVDLNSLFPDQLSQQGISFNSDLAFTLTLALNFDFSASISQKDASLTIRDASVTVQVSEEIDGLVYGHSHFPQVRRENGLLIMNPGSPTDKRQAPFHSVGMLTVGKRLTGKTGN